MKKIISLLLVVALVAALACSCGKAKAAEVIEIDLTTEEYAFGVDKNQPELLTKTNEFIAKIMEDGTFDDICNRYFDDEDGNEKAVTSAKQGDRANQLWVATNAEFAPWEYKEGTQFYGIDMEIAQLIANELGLELVIDDMDFDMVVNAVGKQGVDIAMSGITITAERMNVINFSIPYYTEAIVVVCKEDDTSLDSVGTVVDLLNVICTAN